MNRVSQNYWGVRYIDDYVSRRIDRTPDQTGESELTRTFDDGTTAPNRYVFLTDAQFSVVATADHTGGVIDRVLASFKRDIRDPIAHRFPAQDGGPGFASSVIRSFRHFAVNEARRAGMNADLRKAIFGHADEQTHDIYVSITDDEIGAAAGRMAGLEERSDHHRDSQPPAAPGRQDQAEHHREHNPSRNPAGRRSREGSV